MVRTVISVGESDKRWLDAEAKRRGMTMTALVRLAIGQLRASSEEARPSLATLLESTRGSWPGPDGLEYQRRLREDW